MNNQTTHSAKMLKITVSFGWIDYTRQLWDLPYSVLCLQKEGFLNTFWQGCLTALNSPDMQCIIQKNYNFFYSAPDQSKHGKQALTQAHKQCWLPAFYVSMYGCNSLASQTFKQHHECFVLLKLSCWKSVCELVCQSVIS